MFIFIPKLNMQLIFYFKHTLKAIRAISLLRMDNTGNHDECQQHQTLYEFPMNLHNFVF